MAVYPATLPRWTAGLLVMLTFLIAAAVTIWGTFEKLTTFTFSFTGTPSEAPRTSTSSTTWWEDDRSTASTDWYPPYGLLPAVGAGLLIIAAIIALTTFAGRRSGLVTAVRVSAGLGIGLVAGVVSIRLMDALAVLDRVNKGTLSPGESVDFQLGLGIYLLGGAAVLGIVGLAITLNRGRAARIEPDTPRMGIPMPYQPQQYQPYVQQPTSQPIPAPVSQPIPDAEPPTSSEEHG